MADVQHTFGSDLTVSATGSIALSSGTQLGEERVIRRLMTNPGAYIWQLAYGAGLPGFIGSPAPAARIAAVARTQMFLEAIVSRTPAPSVDVASDNNGTVTLSISYVDAPTQQPVVLSVPVTG
jgi:hypothetical protein